MRKTFIAIAAAGVLASSSAWAATAIESPYENAADVDLEQMASNILAASLCKGTLFNGESVVPHLVAASIVLGRKRAEDAFFSGIRNKTTMKFPLMKKRYGVPQQLKPQKNETRKCSPRHDRQGPLRVPATMARQSGNGNGASFRALAAAAT
jgi:hypothetical protein